ncbi:MAG: baseplate J/gp47 family protein [Candidatus Solibacter sp.]
MSYAAEPYVQFVDDLLTALTGGVIREEFRFLPENVPYRLHAPGPPVPSTIRVFGQAAGTYRRFQSGKDYKVEPDFTITWLAQGASPAAGAIWPDDGATFYVNYDYIAPSGANPPLTDRNPGSVTRLLAESFAREYAVLSRQLEAIYQAGFVETAGGRDLDQIGLLVGVSRRTATSAVGSAIFLRSTPAPADIFIPAGTRVSTVTPPAAQFETLLEGALRRGSLSVEVTVQSLVAGPAGVVAAESIQVINRPILGAEAVHNPQATAFQSANETDDQLRGRIQRALEGAGQATPGALLSALTTIPGLREKDIQILEDPISRPGVIELNVALPELPPGKESELLQQYAEQAVALIEQTRPVGVRILHNIDAPKPLGPAEPGPAEQPDEGDAPATAGIAPTGSLSLPVDVNVWLTPATRSLTETERNELIRAGVSAVHDFIADAGLGETVVYNGMVARLMALPGVLDVALEVYPQADPAQPRRKNILPINPSLRPVAGKVDVQLRGSLIVLDVSMAVTRKGAGLLTDPLQLSSTISSDVTAALNAAFRTGSLAVLSQDSLKGLLGTAETYALGTLDYSVEYQDAGVRVRQKNPQITPSQSDQFWARRVTVEVQ